MAGAFKLGRFVIASELFATKQSHNSFGIFQWTGRVQGDCFGSHYPASQ